MQPLLTPQQLADFLQVSKGHVYRLIQQRRIPFIKQGGSVRFRPESIEKWILNAEIVDVNRALKKIRQK
jgi:excisionase family DNA binding protein